MESVGDVGMVPIMVGLATCPLFDGDCGGGAEMCLVCVLAV